MNAVGIDVSKESMVAALRPMGEVALLPGEFLHTEVGLEQMAYAITTLEDTRVIIETTGRYHRTGCGGTTTNTVSTYAS